MITHIIWDYNGTVLDDAAVSVAAVNDMLDARGLPRTDLETYRKTLDVPLEGYYAGLGFTDVDISELSVEFRRRCQAHPELAGIFDGVREAVSEAKKRGIRNVLMSSLYQEYLDAEAEKYGLFGLFDEVIGMSDRRLGSKLDNCKAFMERHGLSADGLLFVGDLISDAKTAKALGARCVLIPNGHNSRERCAAHAEVLDSVYELKALIGSLQ